MFYRLSAPISSGIRKIQPKGQVGLSATGDQPEVRVNSTPALRSRVTILVLLAAALASAGSAWAFRPNDDGWTLQWPQGRISLARAWNVTRGNRHVIVAVVDSGVNPKLRDLRGALVRSRDFVTGGYTKVDTEGHGTLMASIIAARGNNGTGIPGYCWSCRVMPVRVAAGPHIDNSLAAKGIRWAADHGARIITLSFSEDPGEPPDPSIASAIAYAARKDILVVSSAGNTYGGTSYTFPAADNGAYPVAGTNKFDNLSPWSAKGSWIHLAAPGCQLGLAPTGEVVEPCGTSAAAPAVAGVAALMLSVNPSLTVTQIISILEHTSKPIAGIAGGRVNAYAAVRLAGAQAALTAGAKPVTLTRYLRGHWHVRLAIQGTRVAATLRSADARPCSLSLSASDAVWLSGKHRRHLASLVAQVSNGNYLLDVSCKLRRPRRVALTVRAYSH